MRRKKKLTPEEQEQIRLKEFLDMIAPSVIRFNTDHYICGNTYRCVWALREYPTSTEEQAILRHLGEKHGVTLHIYTRLVTPLEERRIIHAAASRNRMKRVNTQDIQQTIAAESNLQDVASLVASMHRNHEPLLHCAVFLELTARSDEELKELQTDVQVELVRSKLNVDKLLLRQLAGFCCVSPIGFNICGEQFERVLPASSVANLYPFNYSGKTDPRGFYIGNSSSEAARAAQLHSDDLLSSTVRLFYHMSRIFRDNAAPPGNPMGIRIDSKRRKKLMEKRLAMGHKQDDHEVEQEYGHQLN